MITLSLLQFLQDNGFGVIDQNLFWQKLSLGEIGVYIVDLGQDTGRTGRKQQRYELYSRGVNDVEGLERLNRILDFLNSSYNECNLPACPIVESSTSYSNVTIMPLSSPTNIGEDGNGRIIWSASGTLIY